MVPDHPRLRRRVEVLAPLRGEKRELVDAAAANARQTLSRKLAEAASQEKLLGALGQAFGIDRPIRRVEVYDNSHIMGTNAIGAMIVAGRNGFMKTHYRTFNIKSQEITPGDDFGMMREVLRRRFARLVKEEGGGGSTLSPLAGRGQGEGQPQGISLPNTGDRQVAQISRVAAR